MLKIITLLGLSSLALFADDSKGGINMEAMIMFFAFIIGTMGITKWAASKTKSASDFIQLVGNYRFSKWSSNCWRLYVCCFFPWYFRYDLSKWF